MSTQYLTPLGFTSERPASLPPLDRRALMQNAHRIAQAFRRYYATYREALAYGLKAAWMQVHSDRTIQSLARQVSAPTQRTKRRPMLGSYAYVGA